MACPNAGVRRVKSKPGQPGHAGWQSASDETAETTKHRNTEKHEPMKANQWELRQSRKSAAQIRADFALASLAYRNPVTPGTLTRLIETIKKHLPCSK
jgi:hypothetical protein